jgi:hypothetical protein
MTLIAPAPKQTFAERYATFAADHKSPAHTVEDGIRHIVEALHETKRDGRWLRRGGRALGDIGPLSGMLRVRFPLAVPTASQIGQFTDLATLDREGAHGVALPTGEWLSHPAVLHAPGQIDSELYLAPWVLDEDAVERIESAGVTGAYARVAWAVGIRTLDGLLEVWDGGVPAEYLLATDGAE